MDEALLDLLQNKGAEFITVKEICKKAGVGRSTFYLHYQGVPDLVKECSEHVNTKFFERFEQSAADTIGAIRTASLDELVFVTDEYLRPYLEFVQDNCSIYRAMLANGHTLQAQERFEALAKHIIDPVLERFGYPSEQRAFVISFYVHGPPPWYRTGFGAAAKRLSMRWCALSKPACTRTARTDVLPTLKRGANETM